MSQPCKATNLAAISKNQALVDRDVQTDEPWTRLKVHVYMDSYTQMEEASTSPKFESLKMEICKLNWWSRGKISTFPQSDHVKTPEHQLSRISESITNPELQQLRMIRKATWYSPTWQISKTMSKTRLMMRRPLSR